MIRAIDSFRENQWRPTIARPRPELPTVAVPPAAAATGITTTVNAGAGEDNLAACLDRLIAAQSLSDAAAAGRALRQAAGLSSSGGPWQILARASDEALDRGSFPFVAKLGLATVFWQAFFRPELAASGLPQAPMPQFLPILLNCFEACTHLPERTIVGADAQSIFDVEDTRNRCQQAFSGLPLADYLTTTPRKRFAPNGQSQVPSPAEDDPAKGRSPLALRKRVFISYVHEDTETVDRLASALISNGLDVWLDRTHLLPGMRWKSVIRKAIHSGDYFIACFSLSYVSKTETFMNEELNIAIDRLRMMHRSRQWFFPVILEECDIPDYEIGPGETLDSLQYLDFSRDWDTAVKKLVTALSPELV